MVDLELSFEELGRGYKGILVSRGFSIRWIRVDWEVKREVKGWVGLGVV